MAILIGGSPSTGSSLLRRMLNRHSDVFCGPETSLFCKKELYEDWNKNKKRLFKQSVLGLKDRAWHHFVGFNLDEEYNYSKARFNELLVSNTIDFPSFIDSFYKPILDVEKKTIWAEKTPSNVFSFEDFLSAFPHGKIIHMVRHPQDCMASLINRGKSTYNAVCTHLVNTYTGLEFIDHPQVFTLKYEDLVLNSSAIIKALCDFLEIEFQPTMLSEDKHLEEDKMVGWNYSETGNIGTNSVGRYSKLNISTKNVLDFYCQHLFIKSTNISVQEIANKLKYSLSELEKDGQFFEQLKSDFKKDKLIRSIKRAYYRSDNYPVQLK